MCDLVRELQTAGRVGIESFIEIPDKLKLVPANLK